MLMNERIFTELIPSVKSKGLIGAGGRNEAGAVQDVRGGGPIGSEDFRGTVL
jgi:hypothetical protein